MKYHTYAWGTVRTMTEEEFKWFNAVNKRLPGKKEELLFTNDASYDRVIIKGINWTPFGFARRVKGGYILALYSRYDKYCDDGTILRDVEDK